VPSDVLWQSSWRVGEGSSLYTSITILHYTSHIYHWVSRSTRQYCSQQPTYRVTNSLTNEDCHSPHFPIQVDRARHATLRVLSSPHLPFSHPTTLSSSPSTGPEPSRWHRLIHRLPTRSGRSKNGLTSLFQRSTLRFTSWRMEIS
jgi:hypothetical protein